MVDYNGSLQRLYRRYKKRAQIKGLTFELSITSFTEITSKNCAYCGCIPSTVAELSPGSKNTKPYIYNGIDRIDNTKGYEDGNCLPCCAVCNYMKGTLTYLQFIYKVNQIHINQTIAAKG